MSLFAAAFSTAILTAGQGGGHIAWLEGGRCPALHIQYVVVRRCYHADPSFGALAVRRGEALWAVRSAAATVTVFAWAGGRRVRRVAVAHGPFGGVATAGNGFAYATATGVFVVTHARSRRLPVPPASRIAADGRRIVLLHGSKVEVRQLPSGSLVTAWTVAGRVSAIAIAGRIVATLETAGGRMTIGRYAVDGRVLGRTRVPARTAPSLSASRTQLVFRVGRSIRLLELKSGRAREIGRADAPPRGLSIDGGQVVWAENIGGHGFSDPRERGRLRIVELGPGVTPLAAAG